jgi:hypothetical protein
VARDVRLVRHHDDRLPDAVQLVEQGQDLSLVRLSRLPVGSSASRIAGRLISARGDRDALLLPAGKLVGLVGIRSAKPTVVRASRARLVRPHQPLGE